MDIGLQVAFTSPTTEFDPESPIERGSHPVAEVYTDRNGNTVTRIFKDDQQIEKSLRKAERAAHARAYRSVVRRMKILEEILPNRSMKKLDAHRPSSSGVFISELHEYLAQEMHIKDAAQVAASFDPAPLIEVVELTEDVNLLRLFGGKSKPLSNYLFCCLQPGQPLPAGSPRFSTPFRAWTDASGLALPPGNVKEALSVVKVPAGTRVLVGTVADNFKDEAGRYALGGNIQIFVSALGDFEHQVFRRDIGTESAADIVVVGDHGVVTRYHRVAGQEH
ncbi:MAG: hypothetical protein QM778_18445 [Myxococcales bacterium]